ncbi:MAG: hypothetical protein JWM21_3443 [Acidobacteria bacterium]|nr:hypothetical protein [Acidobacteriota bacterium]
MIKSTAIILVCFLLFSGCSAGRSDGVAHTESFTAGNDAELKEGAQRISNFKQELIGRGLRVISSGTYSSAKGSRQQFVLTGDYGHLHNLEVTLWTSDRLDADKPHLGAGAQTRIRNETEEQEFRLLEKRLRLVASGQE